MTHYDVLGVEAQSSATEIRSAYRKLVLLHHPDRSADPKSKAIFLAVTEAYSVLNDPGRRQQYDARLAVEGKASRRPQQTPSSRLAEVKLDVNRLSVMFSRGNFEEVEQLARSILDRDKRQPIPYAVLGDLAKMRGNTKEAARLYGYAVQFDPRNPVYRERYSELVDRPVAPVAARAAVRQPVKQGQSLALPFGFGIVLLAASYIFFAKEAPLMPSMKLISTWTLGLIVMLFFCGVALGSCLAMDRLVAGFKAAGETALSPTLALATIAVVSFWGALAMYVALAAVWKAFNASTSRVVASVAGATCVMALASEASGHISGAQTALWGGNLIYLGALCGWMVTDALRAT